MRQNAISSISNVQYNNANDFPYVRRHTNAFLSSNCGICILSAKKKEIFGVSHVRLFAYIHRVVFECALDKIRYNLFESRTFAQVYAIVHFRRERKFARSFIMKLSLKIIL